VYKVLVITVLNDNTQLIRTLSNELEDLRISQQLPLAGVKQLVNLILSLLRS